MNEKIKERRIVIVNQAVNYLTIDICNAFADRFEQVALITGSIHIQGTQLRENVKVTSINKWAEKPAYKKLFAYVMGCFWIWCLLLTRYRKFEVLFISLPPMAYLLKLILPNRCSVLIWDVYPDIFKITGMQEQHRFYRTWSNLNKKVFKKTFRIFTIGNRMSELLAKYVGKEKILITPIWSIFQENGKVDNNINPFITEHKLQDKFIVQYSGNIGLTHNVENMVKLAELMTGYPGIQFQIIGRGSRMPALQQLVKENNLPNCSFLPFQSDDMFPYSLSAASVGVVILDKLASKGSVPSKCYNLMSYGIPSLYLASADSELMDYSKLYKHAGCFEENNLEGAKQFILSLYNQPELYKEYSANALKTAMHFKRGNADKIVALYFADN